MAQFECPTCGQLLECDEAAAARGLVCPVCNNRFEVQPPQELGRPSAEALVYQPAPVQERPTAPVATYNVNFQGRSMAQDTAWAIAATRTYDSKALVTLLLYLLAWLPGVVANILFLSCAKRDEQMSGVSPSGKGCLVAMLWVFVIVPIGSLVLLLVILPLFGASFGTLVPVQKRLCDFSLN